jgi:UV excision repair protein RAD23
LLSGSQSEAVISQMESMGFPRSDINRAMRAAFFNPDRAIEYLLNVSCYLLYSTCASHD